MEWNSLHFGRFHVNWGEVVVYITGDVPELPLCSHIVRLGP